MDPARNNAARTLVNMDPCSLVSDTANCTASNPKSVVNLMIGLSATDDVSLNGSPTVSPTTVASCKGVPFCLSSVSTIFFPFSHPPPASSIHNTQSTPNTPTH